jgi:hypothetical protein
MLRSVKNLSGYRISAEDGNIGRVKQFYFDDEQWTVRYLVVKTGWWIFGRKVLVSPLFFKGVDWVDQSIELNLTKDKIKKSPRAYTRKPVSRVWETNYFRYFSVPVYWIGPFAWGNVAAPVPEEGFLHPTVKAYADEGSEEDIAAVSEDQTRSHLRSSKEVLGYRIGARDGKIGFVDDFVIDDRTWGIIYVIVDTAQWLPGHKVILSPLWITDVIWRRRRVKVDLSREAVKQSPKLSSYAEITRDYETKLFAHYGKKRYW